MVITQRIKQGDDVFQTRPMSLITPETLQKKYTCIDSIIKIGGCLRFVDKEKYRQFINKE